MSEVSPAAAATNFGAWMALIAALLGWMFDGAEMGIFAMVGRAAIQDLLGFGSQVDADQEKQVGFLFGVVLAIFLVGAATGGVLFGWLGDRLGRVRAMSLSVLTYALFTGFCGLAQSPLQLGVLRFIASLGMGGEWSLGVALVMEVWPNRSRALMAGLIGASANAGYLLVGIIGIGLNSILKQSESWMANLGLSNSMVTMLVANKGWRLMMLLGTLPALLTFFFRIFVPESSKWEQEKGRGGTSNWMTIDLVGVLVGAMGPALIVWVCTDKRFPVYLKVIGTVLGLVIATAGYVYPVLRFLQRTYSASPDAANKTGHTIRRMLLAACISGVALIGTWGSTQWSMTWAAQLTDSAKVAAEIQAAKVAAEANANSEVPIKKVEVPIKLWVESSSPSLNAFREAMWKNPREYTQICTAIGAIIGTILAAMLGDWIGRRIAYCLLCLTSLASVIWFYQFHAKFNEEFLFASFVLGTFTASFYGWLPLYLPELFTTKVRATGQGFGFNYGRILAAIAGLQVGSLLPLLANFKTFANVEGGYPVACSFVSSVYLIGMALIWLAPETRGQPLPE